MNDPGRSTRTGTPKVRMAMHLIVPVPGGDARVTVTEMREMVSLHVQGPGTADGLSRTAVEVTIPLTLEEATMLAGIIGKIRDRTRARNERP